MKKKDSLLEDVLIMKNKGLDVERLRCKLKDTTFLHHIGYISDALPFSLSGDGVSRYTLKLKQPTTTKTDHSPSCCCHSHIYRIPQSCDEYRLLSFLLSLIPHLIVSIRWADCWHGLSNNTWINTICHTEEMFVQPL